MKRRYRIIECGYDQYYYEIKDHCWFHYYLSDNIGWKRQYCYSRTKEGVIEAIKQDRLDEARKICTNIEEIFE